MAEERSRLVNTVTMTAAPGAYGWETYLSGIATLAFQHAQWVRNPEDWKPRHRNLARQFHSLANHLLAQYEVPAVMDSCWFAGQADSMTQYRNWFIQLGEGQNLRTLDLDIKLTKRGAHLFNSAPKSLEISAALRWCQVRSLGGGDYLARTIAGSLLKSAQPDEEFWQSVIFFFINHEEIPISQIVHIIAFIHEIKFEERPLFKPDGSIVNGIYEASFSMKGRTPTTLLAKMEKWKRLSELHRQADLRWEKLEIEPFELTRFEPTHERELTWKAIELHSSKALHEEGKWMHNCVADYVGDCLSGETSILRLSVENGATGFKQRLMTIEVDRKTMKIVQVRGRFNRMPGLPQTPPLLAVAPEILQIWAEKSGLSLSSGAM